MCESAFNVPYVPHPRTKKYLYTYVVKQQMHSDKHALSPTEIHIHVSTKLVLYKNTGEIQLPHIVLSILPAFL